MLIPERLAGISPTIGDRVPDEEQFDRRTSGNLDKCFVPVVVARQSDVRGSRRAALAAARTGSCRAGHASLTPAAGAAGGVGAPCCAVSSIGTSSKITRVKNIR